MRRTADRPDFTAWNTRQRRTAVEYERTKADHALPFGCENCAKGAATDREPGWSVVVGLLLCPACPGLAPTKRLIARTIADRESARDAYREVPS